MNKKQSIRVNKTQELVAHRTAKIAAIRLLKFNNNPNALDNKPCADQCIWMCKLNDLLGADIKSAKAKAEQLAKERLEYNLWVKSHRDEANAITESLINNPEPVKAPAKAKSNKPVKRLLVGTGPSIVMSETPEVTDFGDFVVTETAHEVYINKSLYKSQVAVLADFITWDGTYDIDLRYYSFRESWNQFKLTKDYTKTVEVLKWVSIKSPKDIWGDIKLYESGLKSYKSLLKDYSKTINIDWLADPSNLNKSIKSLIRVAKILSDKIEYKGAVWSEQDPFRWNEFVINVKINKYVFTLVNSGLRNSKFIRYQLVDNMLPLIERVKFYVLDKASNKWMDDKHPTGLSTFNDNDTYYYLYLNGVKLHSFIPNHNIECNANIYSNTWKEVNPNAGYRLLKNLLAPWEDYSKADIKACIKWEIINKVIEAEETAIVLRGDTDKVTANIESIYYYIRNNELNIDFKKTQWIFIRIIAENNSYHTNDLDKLWGEVVSKILGNNTKKVLQKHQDALSNAVQIMDNLEGLGIDLDATIYKDVYKLRIDK